MGCSGFFGFWRFGKQKKPNDEDFTSAGLMVPNDG